MFACPLGARRLTQTTTKRISIIHSRIRVIHEIRANPRLTRTVLSQLLKKASSMALWTMAMFYDKACFRIRICREHQAG